MTSDMGPDVTPDEAAAEATHPAVFISHARDDHAVAEQICRLLEENGIGCWIAPRNVDAGRDYADQILDGIESTRVMVLLLSGPANDSVFVKREVERAISKGKVVIPFRIQEVQPSRSLELFISNHQWIDAWVPPLDSRVYVLAAAIRGLLRLPPLHGDEDRAAAVAEVPNLPRPEQLPPQQPLYGTPQPQLPPRQPLYGAPQQPPVPPQPQAYAQPAPQPQAAPTVCPRCRAPLYPGYLCPTCGQVLNAPQVASWAQFAATAPIQEKSGIDRVSAFEAVRISQTSSQKQDYGSTTVALFFHQVNRAARLSPTSRAQNITLVAGSDCSIQVMRSPLLSVAS